MQRSKDTPPRRVVNACRLMAGRGGHDAHRDAGEEPDADEGGSRPDLVELSACDPPY